MVFTSTHIKPKSTSLRLPSILSGLFQLTLEQRNKILSDSLQYFLSWESYQDVKEGESSSVWLDTVEMGIDQKTKLVLSKPLNFVLSSADQRLLVEAETLFSSARPSYKNKGIQTGILRSALIQYGLDQGTLTQI